MYAKYASGVSSTLYYLEMLKKRSKINVSLYSNFIQMNEVFVDTKTMPIIKKKVKPTDQQGPFESRRYV